MFLLQPIGGTPNASVAVQNFFQMYLAGPIILALYLFWKVYSREWRMWVPANEMDITSGRRSIDVETEDIPPVKTWGNAPMRAIRALF